MDKMKITLILILNCLIIIGTTCFAAVGIVNAPSGLVLRKEASKEAESILTISDNTNVEILEKNGDWYKVKYNGSEGYLFAEYVEAKEEQKTENKKEVNSKEETSNIKTQAVKNNALLYKMPSITSCVEKTIKKDEKVTINYELNDWYNVTYGKTSGWIRKFFVNNDISSSIENSNEKTEQESEEKNENNKKAYVDVTNSANVRKDANTSSEIITTLLRNTEVTIISEKGDFYKIKYQDITGYISKSLVSTKPLETVTSRSNSGERKVQNNNINNEQKTSKTVQTNTTVAKSSKASGGSGIVSFAKQFVGYKYTYGGTKPSSGFDCSGFVYYVFNTCGYKLSRSCQVQSRSGSAVSRKNLQPGDLVFFNNTSDGGIGHVAIYIGGGRIVHAANSRSGVRTDTINSGYYNKYYYSARRIAK